MDEVEQATKDRIRAEVFERVRVVITATASLHGVHIPWVLAMPSHEGTHVLSNLEPLQYREVFREIVGDDDPCEYSPADKEALN